MTVSLKRVFLLIVLALVLLGGLLGWSLKMVATPLIHTHFAGATYIGTLAVIPHPRCPPPPTVC